MMTAVLLLNLLGCTAMKATVHLAQIEEPYFDSTEVGAADLAPYEYTLAEQYRLKAHEEWGHSDYGASEDLAKKASYWADQASKQSKYGAQDEGAEERFELIEQIEDDQGLLEDAEAPE